MLSTNGWATRGNENGSTPITGDAKTIRLMVVDDHPAVRLGLVRLLEDQPDFSIEAVSVNADAAVGEAFAHEVDVAVLDYQLPGRNGLWLCRQLKRIPNPPAVVLFSAFADHYLAACAAVAGADAVLNKAALGSELCDAVRAVSRGRRLLPRVPQPVADTLRRRLAEADQLLFGMLLAAMPHAEIRDALRISEAELEAQIGAMLRTLEAIPGESAARQVPDRSPLDLDRVVRAPSARPRRDG
jgi:DNA-binding NarL/FixJ family response regulator